METKEENFGLRGIAHKQMSGLGTDALHPRLPLDVPGGICQTIIESSQKKGCSWHSWSASEIGAAAEVLEQNKNAVVTRAEDIAAPGSPLSICRSGMLEHHENIEHRNDRAADRVSRRTSWTGKHMWGGVCEEVGKVRQARSRGEKGSEVMLMRAVVVDDFVGAAKKTE